MSVWGRKVACLCLCLDMWMNVCGPAYEPIHICMSSCSHICLCYSSSSAWLCLTECRAKINVWGQASQKCELSVSACWPVCVSGLFSVLQMHVFLDMCLSPILTCLLAIMWRSIGVISGFCHPHILEAMRIMCIYMLQNSEAVCLCTCAWWQVTQSPVNEQVCLDQARLFNSPAPLKIN